MNSIRINREELNRILQAGFKTGEFNFLLDILDAWQNKYPTDIECRYNVARLQHLKFNDKEAARILEELFISDPEFLNPYELFLKLEASVDKKAISSAIYVLSGRAIDISDIYPWAVTLRAVRQGIRKKEYAHSERLLRSIIANEQQNLLAVVQHCRLSSLVDESQTLLQLTEIYHKRWPNCLQVDLWRAKALFSCGNEAEAVSLLHNCAAKDPAGIVAIRLWGNKHDFSSLWPKEQFIDFKNPIPSNLSVALNWNRLPAGKQQIEQGKASESLSRESDSVIQKDWKNKSETSSKKQNLPVYVILSTRLGLDTKYGARTGEVIIQKMEELAGIIQQKTKWGALVYLPDDFSYTDHYHLTNINTIDPWKIKLSLMDLDKALKEKSMMIGAVLIVGCHEIVPFHRLPNPTDDSDEDVLSDNPYSTSSGNYLLPEWPVGRLPGEKGNDPGLILDQLRHIIEFHRTSQQRSSLLNRAIYLLTGRIGSGNPIKDIFSKPSDFGYTAAVWRRSSLAAFRPIGNGSELRVSPEFDVDTIDIDNLLKAKCGYFNLHGLPNTPEWYGQKDFSEGAQVPDFPVAINASKIPAVKNNIDLIVTEACYGGYIIDKTIDTSMALKLISIGSQGLVASTGISYGSVYTPLIGADLLSFIIWKYTKDGYSFGEAYMQAKIGLINVMTQRQGYLDGEDQKTLLSFVLYGDPLGQLEPNIYFNKESSRDGHQMEVEAINDRDGSLINNSRLTKEVSSSLHEMLSAYMPGLKNAEMRIREHQIRVNKVIHSNLESKGNDATSSYATRTQVMVSQKTKVARQVHEQFARVTIDENGKIVKLAVSR